MGNKFFSSKAKTFDDEDDLLKAQRSLLGEKPIVETPPVEKKVEVPLKKPEQSNIESPLKINSNKSIILNDIELTGSIKSKSELIIDGTINGDVICDSDVTLQGRIKGNVSASSLHIQGGKVNGDVNCREVITLLKDSAITGNITGKMLLCDGKIEGKINVAGKVEIKENSTVLGDIVCSRIAIHEGAICKGNLETVNDNETKKEKVKEEKVG